MYPGDVIERLRNPYPPRQDSHIGNEADIAHQLIALEPRVAAQHLQLSLIRGEAENCVECGGFAGTVGTDESEDAPLFNSQIDAIERDRRSKGFAESACFYTFHRFSSPLFSYPATAGGSCHFPAGLPHSVQAAEW